MSVDETVFDMTTHRTPDSRAAVDGPSRLSPLERRITLVMSLLLAGVIGGMFWLSRTRVIDAVSNSEMARLQTSADQLSRTLQQQTQRLRDDASRLAASQTIREALANPGSPALTGAARSFLVAERARAPQIHHVSVLDRAGRVIASSDSADASGDRPDRATELETVNEPAIGALSSRGDTVTYTVTAPVLGLAGRSVGNVVVTRRLGDGAGSATLMSGLVGRGARVLLGNADRTLLTDLITPVPSGPGLPRPGESALYRDSAGRQFLGAAALVPATPWMVIVEAPRAAVLRAVGEFTFESGLFGSAFVILGAFVSWLLIRRTMRPLSEVTEVAREIAAGDMSRRTAIQGKSEIAVLGHAFNQMVDRVGKSATDLAARASQLELSNKELNESEAKYRSLFEHLPDGIIVHRDDRIMFANPAALRLLGVNEVEGVLNRSVLDFVIPGDRDVVRGRIGRIQDEARPAPTIEVRLQRADRKVATVEATSMPLRIGGQAAVQTVLHDVSERCLLEEQFRQSQKMDAVGRLAGGVAHDFNNLLTVIQAHAEFALAEDADADERRRDIEEIRKTAENAARLTRQLLTFSRKQTLSPAPIDLNDAVAGMLGMVRRLIGDDIEVVTVAGENLRGIWADPGQIQQVLLNLAVNARDAMPDGGVLRFETANVTVGEGYVGASAAAIPPGDYVMLAVQDTGVGMTEEIRSRVFEPFFTTKNPGQGTGLGLSTVYGIVKQSGGHIWVYSEPGMGAAFKVFFPPYGGIDPATGEHRIPGDLLPSSSAHLLVVEDDASVRTAIVRALRGAGYFVTEAGNASEAMTLLRADPNIDLVITDMVMPGKQGIALLAEARAIRPRLPAIVLSGYSEQPANELWRVPDHAVFVEKPVSPAEIIRRVRQLLAPPG